MPSFSLKNTITQFFSTLFSLSEAHRFIQKYRLWIGFWKYGWVSKILIALAIIFGLNFFGIIFDWWGKIFSAENSSQAFAEMGTLVSNLAIESYNFLFTGGLKYVIFLLLEVIIFHVCRRTMEILTKEQSDLTLNTFINAQIRMFKVVIRCYIWEMIFYVGIMIFFGIFSSLDFLESTFVFINQCYFLGLLILDNYNEQFHLTIKESFEFSKQFIGVSLALGLFLNLMIYIPIVGTILGSMIAAVTVCLVMHSISDLHLRKNQEFHIPPIPQTKSDASI